ncbi:PAS domain-containing sensor histidine kinase [Adhaeribacter arboris]|uniref:histidine kinase n=1 Tax=Adhaeribacter arboris TaxID=2072846 RepID=A0A2T2YDE4_9BACT|nr:PAS domain-containing sensor histidine kinase [Adhaeribacter arboris]PSR53523.1 PAS domain-containing sensor histidine kinase [Adhaeribacter arboris]
MNAESENISISPPKNISHEQYRLLVDSITDYAIFLLDPTGRVVSWNPGAQQIKQYQPEEIIGKHFSTFYTAEAKASDYPAMELREAQRLGKFEDEGWRVRKDGSVFWANVIITPIYNEQKTLIGFSKITRNLSERKKAEDDLFKAYEELKNSEERFRLLIEGVTDYAIFMLDPAGNVATWNEGARRLKGYEAAEIIGKFFSKFYSQEAVQSGYPEYELSRAKAEGRFEDEGWRFRKDGSAFWANTVLTAIYNPHHELIGFSKITRDLTEKKRLEQQLFRINEELKESEEKSRLLINSVQDYAILMLNPEGIIVSWNAGAERLKGYKVQEIIGKHFSIFYPREAIQQGFPKFEIARALEYGHFEDEGWRIKKDGTAFWANVVLTPIYNSANRLLGFAKITRDLTERRRNEDLMQKNKELARINNDLDNFVYTASHDLKTPITNLEGLLDALTEEMGPEKDIHQEILTLMQGSIVSLKKVIDDLGDITKLQQEKEAPETVNLVELIEETKDNLREIINTSKSEIKVTDLAFETLEYSRKNLRSILYNLVINAIKYADPQRTPAILIQTYFSSTGEYVLSVADNGLGIADTQLDKIFSIYKRAHTHVEGSGLGLYLVKKILDNSGDRITVESEVGKGSVFQVYFKQEIS